MGYSAHAEACRCDSSPQPLFRGPPAIERTGTQTEANKQLLRRLVDDVVNQRNAEPLDELADNEFAALARHWISRFRSSFPDFRMEIVELVAEDDTVVAHFKWSGHAPRRVARRRSYRPSLRGRRRDLIFHLRDRKLASAAGVEDNLSQIRQLGMRRKELEAET